MASFISLSKTKNVEEDFVLILGPHDAGKTSVLRHLVLGKAISYPSERFNLKTVQIRRGGREVRPMKIWDVTAGYGISDYSLVWEENEKANLSFLVMKFTE